MFKKSFLMRGIKVTYRPGFDQWASWWDGASHSDKMRLSELVAMRGKPESTYQWLSRIRGGEHCSPQYWEIMLMRWQEVQGQDA